jgi:hypothetical protein
MKAPAAHATTSLWMRSAAARMTIALAALGLLWLAVGWALQVNAA